MKKTLLGTSIVALVHAMSAVPALADDTINGQLTNGQLVAFCATAGIGTETPGTLKLSDGTTITGMVSCDADAVNAAVAGDPNAVVGDDGNLEDNQGDDGESSNTGDSGDSGDSGGDTSDDGDPSESGDTGDAGGD